MAKVKSKPATDSIESLPQKKRHAMAARLENIRLRNHGVLTPDAVISDARNPKSPLHDYPGWGKWDDASAAMEHYRNIARHLISGVRIEHKTERRIISVPRYVRDPSCESDEQGYTATVEIKDEKALAVELLREEFRRVEALLERACDIAEVIGLDNEMRAMLKRVRILQDKIAA